MTPSRLVLQSHARRRFTRRLASALALVALVLLVACGAPNSPASDQATFAAEETPHAATRTPAGTPTPDTNPFQISFIDAYAPHNCPVGEAEGSYCATVTASGTATGYGTLKLSRDANLASPDFTDGCVPTSSYGTITVASGENVSFLAEGTHCGSDGSATYTYQINGGTGSLAAASGSGTITVAPITNNSGAERWSGTLVLPH
ncbi:MAG: hypothetical protein OJF49_000520 [Ktedonobacterales bacterium]|jgi:hypothetical protein|nr:MAG: hypothetical protein OJF49_000520 [Ktedonobacterales bacterium]